MVLDKNVYINMDNCKISVRQAGGILQLNDLTVTGHKIEVAARKLDEGLYEAFKVISKYNKQIVQEEKSKNKKTSPPTTPSEKNKKIDETPTG